MGMVYKNPALAGVVELDGGEGLTRALPQDTFSTGSRSHLVPGPRPSGVSFVDVFVGTPAQ